MALADIFDDTDKLREVSAFLLGFGQNTLAANARGMGSLASLGFGFSGGGANLARERDKKGLKELRTARLEEIKRKNAANRAAAADQARFQDILGSGITPAGDVAPRLSDAVSGPRLPSLLGQSPHALKGALTPFLANPNTSTQAKAVLDSLEPDAPHTDIGKIAADRRNRNITKGEAAISRALLLKKALTPKDEFNRNLQRMAALEAAGKADSTEYKNLVNRVAKQTERDKQLRVLQGPDGGLEVSFGPPEDGGLATSLTGKQLLDQQSESDNYTAVLKLIDKNIADIKERPSHAGAIGSLRSFAQDIVGLSEDVLPETMTDVIKEKISQIPGITEDQERDLDPFFDPKLPRSQIDQNTVALELAKLRLQAGDGSVRALQDAFTRAQEDTRLRGAFSSKSALARWVKIRELFADAKRDLDARLVGRRGDSAPKEKDDASPAAIDAIDKELLQFMTPEERALFE